MLSAESGPIFLFLPAKPKCALVIRGRVVSNALRTPAVRGMYLAVGSISLKTASSIIGVLGVVPLQSAP